MVLLLLEAYPCFKRTSSIPGTLDVPRNISFDHISYGVTDAVSTVPTYAVSSPEAKVYRDTRGASSMLINRYQPRQSYTMHISSFPVESERARVTPGPKVFSYATIASI